MHLRARLLTATTVGLVACAPAPSAMTTPPTTAAPTTAAATPAARPALDTTVDDQGDADSDSDSDGDRDGDDGAPDPEGIGIGGGEAAKETHVGFDAAPRMIRARVEVTIDKVAPTGLNFFAIQVDFDNGTWAHGGLQDVDGPDHGRVRQVNWGGLVDRGGGNDDYDQMNDTADLEKIQNPPEGQHLGPYAWENGTTYQLTIERGDAVTLPAGKYHLMPDHPAIRIRHARHLWAWHFTARPVGGGAPFEATLYDGADAFTGFMVWNEAGYGSTATQQHAVWSEASYTALGADDDATPTSWSRF